MDIYIDAALYYVFIMMVIEIQLTMFTTTSNSTQNNANHTDNNHDNHNNRDHTCLQLVILIVMLISNHSCKETSPDLSGVAMIVCD